MRIHTALRKPVNHLYHRRSVRVYLASFLTTIVAANTDKQKASLKGLTHERGKSHDLDTHADPPAHEAKNYHGSSA
jgi:hypothetical protein